MTKDSLRKASIYCLAIWLGVWLLFLLIHFSSFDIRGIPGIGSFMLSALVASFLAPIVAAVLAVAALIRQPRVPLNWLSLGGAVAAFLAQAFIFLATRWM
jgi:hypothetical protein